MTEGLAALLVRKALASALEKHDPSGLPVFFSARVLDRYRAAEGYSLLRTDTLGRLKHAGGWSVDFGIADDNSLIHLTFGALESLPRSEWEHWLAFVVTLPLSVNYLRTRLGQGCIDDGELRSW